MRSHIFEPFFTTKGPKGHGPGTGHGVRDCQAERRLYLCLQRTRPRSTFKVYFPRTETTAESREEPKAAGRGTETILVVEDEDGCALDLTGSGAPGSNVLAAGDGGEALLLCQRHPGSIHLMVTDVVMPKMGGRELAERLAPLRPETKVLYMSGYAEALLPTGSLGFGSIFSPKAFQTYVISPKGARNPGASPRSFIAGNCSVV